MWCLCYGAGPNDIKTYQRNHRMHERYILVFQPLHIPHQPGFRVVHVEHWMGQIWRGSSERSLHDAVSFYIIRLCDLEEKFRMNVY